MDRVFRLPDLGEGLTEASVVQWLVAPGDEVAVDQNVIEVESAKSTVELPSPFAGVIGELHVAAGDIVHAGQALFTMAGADAASAPAAGLDAASGGAADEELVPGTALRASEESSGAVLIGYGLTTREAKARTVRHGRFGGRSSRSGIPTAASESAHGGTDAAHRSPAGRSPVVSPLVRRLAREHGFSASDLVGTGPGSLVMRSDVERRIAQGAVGGSVAPASASVGSAPVGSAPVGSAPESARVSIPSSEGDVRIPLTGIRKTIAERMAASRRDVPEATIWLDVDATELLAAKEQLQRSTGERWSFNALIARFAVAGLKKHPILNSSVDTAAGEIVQHAAINLGVAAQTARGLMVPVIHGAGDMTSNELRTAMADVVETAKTGNFTPAQLTGSTFTLNNYGGFGVDGSAPIINLPEVAMLGVGRIMDRPWVVDGALAVRKVMVLSMVFDHRVCDGDVPSEFITFVARCIENPIALLGEL